MDTLRKPFQPPLTPPDTQQVVPGDSLHLPPSNPPDTAQANPPPQLAQSNPFHPIQSISQPQSNISQDEEILKIHQIRLTSSAYTNAPKDKTFTTFWYPSGETFADFDSKQLSGQYGSCALVFASESEKRDFVDGESRLLPEGSSYRVNLFDHFVEVKMPESFLHGLAGQALGQCILKQITAQLYLPGTDVDDTGLGTGGSSSISSFAIFLNCRSNYWSWEEGTRLLIWISGSRR
jgi:hypothetical protein